MHQRLRRFGPWVLVGLASLLFMGCTQILNLIEGATGSTNNPTPPPAAADSIRVVISELQANLITANIGITAPQAAVIAKSAQDNVTASKVSETDFEKAFPVALAGAEIGLADTTVGFNDTSRIKAVGLITTSFMGSLNGRFDATSRSISNSRALTLSAQVVTNLLARLSKAAVANLVNTGITADSLGKTAGDVVGNMITGLASGGVNKALVSEALVQITQNAVSSLKDAGVDDTAMAVAVQAVTKGAVSAIATIKVEGVTTADYPAMTKQITSGAAASLESVISSTVDMKTLVASVATGSTEGIAIAVKTVSLDTTQVSLGGSDILKAMVQSATDGTTAGVMKNLSVNVSADAVSLIGAVTAAASKQLEINKLDMQLTSTDIQASVATGASSAAQTALSGALSNTDLQTAIVFKDAAGTVTDLDSIAQAALSTAINTGIAQASNAPPVAVFNDMAVVVNHLATLDGNGSSDDKDTVAQLKFLWTLLQKPKASGANLSETTLPKVTFTPDVAGSYLISLKVTDSQGAESIEVYGVVTATADNTNVLYNGKSAPDRLTNAKALMKTGDYPEARDELLTILGHYPDGALFDETILKLAQAYEALGDRELAGLRYREAGTRTTPAAGATLSAFGAQIRLIACDFAMKDTAKDPDLAAEVTTALQEVITARAGTTDEGEAQRLLANLLDTTGKHAEAVEALKAVLLLPAAKLAPESRYWAAFGLGWAYNNLKDWTNAIAAFQASHAYVSVGPDSRWSLSLFKYCDAMWPWWFGGNPATGYSQADQGIKAIEVGIADATIDASDRMEMAKVAAEFYIWGNGSDAASRQKAVTLLTGLLNATSSVTDTTTAGKRVWVQLRLGQAYQNVRDSALTDTERQALTVKVADAFTQAQTLGWGKWYGWRPAGEAMVEAAGNGHWNSSDPQKDAKALLLLSTVISNYPAGGDSYPKAFAYFRQGEIYRDIGNDLRNQSGKDYRTPLQNAIGSFSKVTVTNFPDLDPKSWFFANAAQNMGNCYTSLGNFSLAESYFKTSLNDPNVSNSDKVWSQLSLANCYGEQVMQLLQEGNVDAAVLDSAQTLWSTKALPAFEAVAGYKEADGTPISRGEPAAHALLQQGRYLQNAADTTRWNLNMAPDIWTPLYQQAIQAFQKITPAAFPSLPSDGWEFIEAANSQADCQFKLGIYDQGRAALQAILQDMDNGKLPEKQRWGVMKQLVSSYRDEAQNLGNNLNDIDRVAVMAQRISKQKDYLTQAQALFTAWTNKGQGNQEATNITAWVLTEEAWSYLDIASVMGWDYRTTANGDYGYTADDWTALQDLQSEVDALKAQITGNPAIKDANSGQSLARLYRVLGHWNQDWANRLADGTSWVTREGRLATALTYYDLVIANTASDMDDYGAALSSQVGVKSQYARNAPDLAVRKAAFKDALAILDKVIVNPRVYINQVAWSCITVAQLYRDLHSSYYKDSSQLGGLGLPDMDGPSAWQTVVALLMQPIVDHSGNYGKLNDGGAYNEAKRLLADAQNAKITVQVW